MGKSSWNGFSSRKVCSDDVYWSLTLSKKEIMQFLARIDFSLPERPSNDFDDLLSNHL